MSILAFGGEMGFFLPSDSNSLEATSSGKYNGSFARCTTAIFGGSAYSDSPAITAQSNFWLHCDVFQDSGVTSLTTQSPIIELLDSGGISVLRLTCSWLSSGSSGTWQIEHWNGTSWTALGNCTAAPGALQTIDIHVVSNTASGSMDFYMAGTKRIASGTLNLSTTTGITKVRTWGTTRGIRNDTWVSQMVLASESTIGMCVGTIYMSGQGVTHTFDVGGFANIDEIAYSDADFDKSGTAGQIELFAGTSVFNFSGYSIRALALTLRGKTDGSAPTKFRFQLRSGGVVYDNGADLTLDFGYGNFCAVWENNPATSARFQPSEISALQYGLKSVT